MFKLLKLLAVWLLDVALAALLVGACLYGGLYLVAEPMTAAECIQHYGVRK